MLIKIYFTLFSSRKVTTKFILWPLKIQKTENDPPPTIRHGRVYFALHHQGGSFGSECFSSHCMIRGGPWGLYFPMLLPKRRQHWCVNKNRKYLWQQTSFCPGIPCLLIYFLSPDVFSYIIYENQPYKL